MSNCEYAKHGHINVNDSIKETACKKHGEKFVKTKPVVVYYISMCSVSVFISCSSHSGKQSHA